MKTLSTTLAVCATALVAAQSALAQSNEYTTTTFRFSEITPRFEFNPSMDQVGSRLNTLAAARFDNSGRRDGTWPWQGSDHYVIAENPLDPNSAVIAHDTDEADVACLPYEIRNTDNHYEILASTLIQNRDDAVAIGWMNNQPDRGGTFADGRGELWAEIFFASDEDYTAGLASYRVMAHGDEFTLATTQQTGLKLDVSQGFVDIELGWNNATETLAVRVGDTDLITGQPVSDTPFNGLLSGLVDQDGNAFNPDIEGIGFQFTGTGGAIKNFAATPEPSTAILAGIVTLLALTVITGRRQRS